MIIEMNTAVVESRVVSFLRFPLVMFVLLIHSDFRGINAAWSGAELDAALVPLASISLSVNNIIEFISDLLAPLANPFFFFISGFLFFNGSGFGLKDYRQKLRRRVRSLLVPYILWNAIFLVALFLAEEFVSGKAMAISKPIAQFGVTDFLLAFWDISLIGGQGGIAAPVDITMWFVRDLMVPVLVSPAIYWLVRRLSAIPRSITLIGFGALLFFVDRVPALPGLNAQAMAFFMFGAFFGINRVSFSVLRPYTWGALLFAVTFGRFGLHNLMYAALVVLFIALATRWVQSGRCRPTPWLTDACFFVFASHTLLLGLIVSLFKGGVINPSGSWALLLCYLLCPAILFIVCSLVFHVFNRLLPGLTAILTGGRSRN